MPKIRPNLICACISASVSSNQSSISNDVTLRPSSNVPSYEIPLLARIHKGVIPFTTSHEQTRRAKRQRDLNFEVMPFAVSSETRRAVTYRIQVSQLQSDAFERFAHLGRAVWEKCLTAGDRS